MPGQKPPKARIPSELSESIRRALTLAGLSQRKASLELGKAPSYIKNVRGGALDPSQDELRQLIQGLARITKQPESFFKGRPTPTPDENAIKEILRLVKRIDERIGRLSETRAAETIEEAESPQTAEATSTTAVPQRQRRQ